MATRNQEKLDRLRELVEDLTSDQRCLQSRTKYITSFGLGLPATADRIIGAGELINEAINYTKAAMLLLKQVMIAAGENFED